MRPEYEREVHRESERAAKALIEATAGIQLHKSPRYYHIDYFATRKGSDSLVGWMEIRGKQFAKHSFPTFYTSIEKFISVSRMGHVTKRPAIIVAQWTDFVGFIECDWKDAAVFDIRLGGRTSNSRGDAQDIEPVIHIPVDSFKPLSELSKIFQT